MKIKKSLSKPQSIAIKSAFKPLKKVTSTKKGGFLTAFYFLSKLLKIPQKWLKHWVFEISTIQLSNFELS